MRSVQSGVLAAMAGLAVATPLAVGGPIEVIFCKKAGHPKAVLPGAVDLAGNPEVTEWRAIEQLSVSADGSVWFIHARSQAATDHDVSMVKGSGTTGSVLVATVAGTSPAVPVTFQEGRPAPFHTGSANQDPLTWDYLDFFPAESLPRFDSSSNAVFGPRARQNQTGMVVNATDSKRVIKWNKASNAVSLAFRQLDLYTGVVENPTNGPQGDEALSNNTGTVHLLDSGVVGSHDSAVLNLYSLLRSVLAYDRVMFHQLSTRTPNPDILTTSISAGAFGAVGERYYWTALDGGEFYTTPSGQHHYIEGRILDATTATDGVLAVGTPADSAAVLREGSDIPGSSPAINVGDIFQTAMASNGDWYARGRNVASDAAWFVKNGVVLARTGDGITGPNSTERWANTFFSFAPNAQGDWILVGKTNNPDPNQDDVVVLNGTEVIMRENDPVDLDGNGTFDDDAFIGQGPNTGGAFNGGNHWHLTDTRVVYGILNLRNGAGANLNSNPAFTTPSAFIRKSLDAACYANCDASTATPVLNVADFTCFLTKYASGDPYANCDASTAPPTLNVADFTCFLTKYAAGCP